MSDDLAACVGRARVALSHHDSLASLLADLLHYAEHKGEDFERALSRARDNFEQELAGEDEE